MICPGTERECDNPGCRHGGCQGRSPTIMAARDPLPRPDVNVTTTADGKEHLVISRDGKAKSYEIGDVGGHPVPAGTAPDDDDDLRGERLVQGHRRRLAAMPPACHAWSMAWEDLSEEERAALLHEMRAVIAADRFPLSPRIKLLRRALDKLDPPPAREVMPPPKPPGEPSWARRKKRR